MYTPHTFITRDNRKGVPCEALHYICAHGLIMSECDRHFDPAFVEGRMVAWWNETFTQMRERIVKRDQMLRGDNVS